MRRTSNAREIPVNIVGSSVFGRFPKISSEITYNMYESDGWMINFPGYRKTLELIMGNAEGRGIFRSYRANIVIAVANSNVYRISNNLSVQLIGSLDTSYGEVSITENLNNQICIVDGLNAYIYNYRLAPNLTKQTGGNFGTALIPSYVQFHNTFFLFGNSNRSDTGARWYAYEASGDTTLQQVSALTFQTKPDYPLAVIPIPSQASNVLVMGESCCEIQTNVGGIQNYRKNTSVNIDYGVKSVSTIASSDTHIMWLGSNHDNAPVLMAFTGQQAVRISTDGIDYLLENIKHPEKSTGSFFRTNGHLFYMITFFDPKDNITLAYDVNEGKFYNLTNEKTNYHPARQFVYFNNNIYFISIYNGCIYRLDPNLALIDNNLDDGDHFVDPRFLEEIPRVRVLKTIRSPNTAPFRLNSLTFPIDMGNDHIPAENDCIVMMITEDNIPIVTEDGIQVVPEDAGEEDCESYPYQGRIDCAVSGNGGETWSNYVPRYLNPAGYRRNIFRWENMGMYNEATIKLRFWTLGRICVYNGIAEVF